MGGGEGSGRGVGGEMARVGGGWRVCAAPLSEAFDGPRRTATRACVCGETQMNESDSQNTKGSSGRRISAALMRFVEEVGAPR